MNLTIEDILKTSQLVPGIISIYKTIGTSLEPLYISSEVASLSAMNIEEYKRYIGNDASTIIIPEDREIVAKALIALFTSKHDASCIYRIYNKKTGYIWIHANARKIGEMDNMSVILATFFNTSHETNVQENLLNHINNSVYVIDENSFELLYANENALNRWNKRDFIGKQCFKFISDRLEQCPWCAIKLLKSNELHVEETYVPNRDKWFTIDCQKISWYGRPAIAIFSKDITNQKKTQLSLKESNENLKATINNIPVGICVYCKQGDDITCIATNPYLARTKGIVSSQPGKKIDDDFFNRIYPGEGARFKENFLSIFKNGYNVFDYRTISGHITETDGSVSPSYVWLHLEGYAADQNDGSQIAYICYTNITQEKESEEEAKRLRRLEEEQYSHTIDGIMSALPKTIGIAHLDLTQNIYSNCHTAYKQKKFPLEIGSVDYLLNYITDLFIIESEKKAFKNIFNRNNLLSVFTQGQNYLSFDYRFKTPSETIRWATIAINMARNPKNGDLEAVLYSVDSDERITKNLISNHILSEDYDNIAIIDVLNKSINFISANDALLHDSTFYDDDIRASLSKSIPEDERLSCLESVSLKNVLKELETRDCFIYSFSVKTQTNNKLRKQVRFSYLDETNQKILLTCSDITQSTQLEAEQKAKLEEALATAEKANEMKSVFLSTVSHDMRTPLNGIIGYTMLALQNQDKEEIHKYLEKISTASNALLLLINDTLDLARIENGNETLKPEPTSTTEFINAIITTVNPSMDAKHISFIPNIQFNDNLYVICDKMRMEKVLLNLLSNAAKFTPENGTITFTVKYKNKDGTHLLSTISVKDTGCGMSEDFIPKAFEPFTQERTEATANIGGSGLGLSIVKRLVDLMGGHIKVSSKLGKGTTFTLTLPFEIVNNQTIAATPIKNNVPVDLRGKHILLCEDNAVNREIAIALLEGQGIIVTIAINGREGVKAFSESKPGTFDAILMDIRMPLMNGYDAAEEIRSLHRGDASLIPIIAMTADAYDGDVKHCIDCGMNEHISKPIDTQKLFDVLKKYC